MWIRGCTVVSGHAASVVSCLSIIGRRMAVNRPLSLWWMRVLYRNCNIIHVDALDQAISCPPLTRPATASLGGVGTNLILVALKKNPLIKRIHVGEPIPCHSVLWKGCGGASEEFLSAWSRGPFPMIRRLRILHGILSSISPVENLRIAKSKRHAGAAVTLQQLGY
jgi:hypothetical protein